jgi:hypothetical protein
MSVSQEAARFEAHNTSRDFASLFKDWNLSQDEKAV